MELQEQIQKVDCKNLFEFVLAYTPKDYTNSILSDALVPNTQVVVEVEVLRFSSFKVAKVLVDLPFFNKEAELIIFNAKPYHKAIFKEGEKLIVSGKLQKNAGFLSILQPKVLKENGKVAPNFNTKGAKTLMLKNMVSTFTLEQFIEAYPAVKRVYLEGILEIFCPTLEFYKRYLQNGGFPKKNLEALKFVEIYEYMRKLRSKKREFQSISALNGKIDSWFHSLPFSLTKGQQEAICEIQKSLNSTKAARRVIVGDVGCGKTMVIFASVMMAYPKKSVLMAPTSILAKQIFEESKKFLPPNIKVALFMQNDKVGDLKECEFIIGTHALLYEEELKDCQLVMIDEQHRFGTAQRNTLERMFEKNGKRPHILQFSATPIPRTFAMIESNFLDFSFILDLPFKKNIKSRVIHKSDFKELLAHIQKEISLQHQIIIVYPLVEESEKLDYISLKEGEEFWRKHFSGVYVTHGKDKQKESILENFRDKGNILLATTIIEVGISLPKLSTIIIVGAERLGLATLHQLRGRVSRNGLEGYCFLYTNQENNERLKRFVQIQNGFEIAKMDLEFRNSGDLLSGEQQSGKQFSWINLANDEEIIKEAKMALENNL
ncbi:ATP-dependent DNA helicase RecG [Helicobacter burdigaliensis]|uniref:ATP-dependent DNA helicase RecG n=1 Tax=Helicobacter burdigaliensis TaxID=2315334 RepID=UPI0018E51606